MDWKDLSKWIRKGILHTRVKRSPEVDAAWQKAREDGRVAAFASLLASLVKAEPCVLSRNAYPYNVDASHEVAWGDNDENAWKCASLAAASRRPGEVLLWQNPPEACSIPQIPHVHVFTRRASHSPK